MAIKAGGDSLVCDILFEDILSERIEVLFNLHVGFNTSYSNRHGRGIEVISFRKIRFS